VYFGLLLDKSKVGLAESEKLIAAIFILPGLASRAPGVLLLPYSGLYCRGIIHRRLEKLSIRKPGAPDLNLWPESSIQKLEILSKVPEMVRKLVKLTVIRKNVMVKPEVNLQNRK